MLLWSVIKLLGQAFIDSERTKLKLDLAKDLEKESNNCNESSGIWNFTALWTELKLKLPSIGWRHQAKNPKVKFPFDLFRRGQKLESISKWKKAQSDPRWKMFKLFSIVYWFIEIYDNTRFEIHSICQIRVSSAGKRNFSKASGLLVKF